MDTFGPAGIGPVACAASARSTLRAPNASSLTNRKHTHLTDAHVTMRDSPEEVHRCGCSWHRNTGQFLFSSGPMGNSSATFSQMRFGRWITAK